MSRSSRFSFESQLFENRLIFLKQQTGSGSILLPELRTWLQSWDLGLSFEAVHGEARRRLYGRMERFIAEQAAWIEALLAEAKQPLPVEERTVRAQTTVMLAQMFTLEDWEALADTAAQGVL